MHRTTEELSPEELNQYRLRINDHFQNRDPVDEALLHRAWQTAHQAAALLYESFGATQVAVFGSLAERDWFSKQSDIDIAVWDIPSNSYFSAEAPLEYRRNLEAFVARHFFDFYKGLESIFQRIAQDVDRPLPSGAEWHKDLIQPMAESNTIRLSVLSQETSTALQNLRGFRHVFIYIYADELDYEQVLENAERVKTVFLKISAELDIFIAWLEQHI